MVLWQVAAVFADTVQPAPVQSGNEWSGANIIALIGIGVGLIVGLLGWWQSRRQNKLLRQQNELLQAELHQQRELSGQEAQRQAERERRQREERATQQQEATKFDEDRYLNWIINQHRFLNITGLRTRAPVEVEVEQVYVSLSIDPRPLPEKGVGERKGWRTEELAALVGRREQPERITIARAFEYIDHHRFSGLVILGGPGTGKTTVLKYLALAYARGLQKERLHQPKALLPLFVTLRDITAESRGHSLAEYLSQVCTAAGIPIPAEFFSDKLQAGQCLVLLDSLDEVASPEQRLEVAEWIRRQCEACGKNPFVITCRIAGFREEYLPPRFLRLEIQDFDEEDVARFARNWCLAVETMLKGSSDEARQAGEQAGAELVKTIRSNTGVKALAVNPLILSIIAWVHRRGLVLPQGRVELYKECIEVLLVHWEEAKRLPVPIPAGKSLQVLQPLALWMHEQRQREGQEERAAHREEIKALIAAPLAGIGFTAGADVFLDSIRDRSGLLVERSLDIFGFQHQTFQEYLAAREIATHKNPDLLLAHFGEDYWREVTLLYGGTQDSLVLLGGILGLDDGRVMAHWPLVLQLQEETLSADAETQRAVSAHPFAVLLRTEEPSVGVRAAIHVRRETPAVDILLRHFAAAQAPLTKGHLSLLLGESGEQRAIEVLEAHLADEDLHLRCLCALALDLLGYNNRQALEDILVVRLPAGEFVMGNDGDKSNPKRRIATAGFCIDRFPLTNGQYRRFVEAGGYREKGYWSEEGWKWKEEEQISAPPYEEDPQFNILSAPVVGISWYEAEAYGRWVGKRLPTEQEWERAARGDADVRTYPWGDEFDAGKCNTRERGIGQPTPAGSYPNGMSPHGCLDMAGNVWEWTASLYTEKEAWPVVRGGSWFGVHGGACCAYRGWLLPEVRLADVGVRFLKTS